MQLTAIDSGVPWRGSRIEEAILKPLADGWTLPATWYSEPEGSSSSRSASLPVSFSRSI